MKEPIVRFERIQKSYDDRTMVVKELNLDIPRGEFLTLLGPSGSGKTTCLMMLAGFETPSKGEIYLNSAPINRVPPHKRNIGMVFQNYALFPHMSVAENLAYPLKIRGLSPSEIASRVTKSLDTVQLEKHRDKRPTKLSGGQQQRVAVARALIFDPEIVLMDEPLGALDKQLRMQMQYEIKHIQQRLGVTLIYVTHDQSEALTMSDRIAVFNEGRIQQIASPEQLYERPESAFVADFVGENNRIRGHVARIEDAFCEVVTESGDHVKARLPKDVRPGAPVTINLRPERIEVTPAAGQKDNHIVGTVEELVYFGDHVRAHVKMLGSGNITIKIPNSSATVGLKQGTTVQFGWQIGDCHVFPE